MTLPPFQAVLGPAFVEATPGIRAHFGLSSGTQRYRGVLKTVWRRDGWRGRLAAPALWLGSRANTLFADTGTEVPFELENRVVTLADGRPAMIWSRVFHFPRGTRRFDAMMAFDPGRGVLIDWLGKGGHLEVELLPRVEGGGIIIESGRQRIKIGPWWAPLPRWLAGQAQIREWERPDGSFGVRVTIRNPLLGDFFGYEGTFAPVPGE